MGTMNSIGPVSKRLTTFRASTSVWDFMPFTEWIPAAAAVQKLRAVLKSTAEVGTFEYRIAIQTAAVRPDAPGPWQALGSTIAANNESVYENSTFGTTYTTGAAFVRVGLAYRVPTGTSPVYGQATVEVAVLYSSFGRVIAKNAVQFDHDGSDTTYHNVPMTPWIPAIWLSHLQMTLSVANESGYPSWQGIYQTAATSIEAADPWATFGVSYNDGGEWNDTERSLSITTKMWVRFGIRGVNQATQTGQFTGWVEQTIAIRKA